MGQKNTKKGNKIMKNLFFYVLHLREAILAHGVRGLSGCVPKLVISTYIPGSYILGPVKKYTNNAVEYPNNPLKGGQNVYKNL